MYTKVHVALDGSKQAKGAAGLGLELAKGMGARLVAVHVDAPSRLENRVARLRAALPTDALMSDESRVLEKKGRVRTGWLADEADDAGISFASERHAGLPHEALLDHMANFQDDLLILGSCGQSGDVNDDARLGSVVERYLRRSQTDTLVVKDLSSLTVGGLGEEGAILVCIDGSPRSYAALNSAMALAKRFNRRVEAVGVYDPYLHYTLFNGIVGVLSEKASKVFKFADQEKLHEEIIDTGLAKIYQAHLEVARKVAADEGIEVRTVLLDGKAYEKILQYIRKTRPALTVFGRIGVHSDDEMDIGSTAENLLRSAPCNMLITSQQFLPPVDVQAAESVEWTPAALSKMERVPGFVKGVATTAIVRWAIERGHSVITAGVVNDAMGDMLPTGAAQAMGYVAEELAKNVDDYQKGKTFLCPECGYAAKDFEPKKCPVCKTDGAEFQMIDRAIIEKVGELGQGDLIEEKTFDGKTLAWSLDAQQALARVPKGYDRRRTKARIEKTARVRGFETITKEFALDVIQQDLAENSYLSDAGEVLKVEIRKDEAPDDVTYRQRANSTWLWTDAAWKRIERVPAGFMRDMSRERVEQFAAQSMAQTDVKHLDLELCEAGIAEGRKMMAEMLGSYNAGGADASTVRNTLGSLPGSNPEAPVVDKAAAPEVTPDVAPEEAEAKCPVPDHVVEAMKGAPGEDSKCPAAGLSTDNGNLTFTSAAEQVVAQAKDRVVDAGKFEEDRADQLSRGVAQERAKEKRMLAINETFMARLGKQLGYGHPLAEETAQYNFEWTAAAEKRLEDIPEFCREMTRWRVEWTAVKNDLGRVITPEIMDAKYAAWGEVSDAYMEREGKRLDWAPEAWKRIENIPSFVQGQVVESIEGNARQWGHEVVTSEILDKVIDKWIETGDFHEAQFGYK